MNHLKSGALDPDFGQDGRLALGEGRSNVRFRNFRQDREQRILAVGSSEQVGTGGNCITLARFTAEGALDATFNDAGYWLSSPVKRGEGGLDLGVQADGACLIVALCQGRIVLLHRSAQGQTREMKLTPSEARPDVNAVVALQEDGAFWAACSYLQPDLGGRILLTRRRHDGHPDNGFAQGGTRVLGQGTETFRLLDMTVREDEHDVIVALNASGGPKPGDQLYCLDADTGALKDTFAEKGIFTYSLADQGYYFTGFNRVLYDKGQLWLAGYCIERATTPIQCFFLRLTAEGRVDSSFNSGKPVIMQGIQPSVGVQSDGKVLLLASTTYPDNVLRRYLPNGELDHGFGEQGEVIVGRESEQINTLQVQADDKLLAGAYDTTSGTLSLALYRLLG